MSRWVVRVISAARPPPLPGVSKRAGDRTRCVRAARARQVGEEEQREAEKEEEGGAGGGDGGDSGGDDDDKAGDKEDEEAANDVAEEDVFGAPCVRSRTPPGAARVRACAIDSARRAK